MSPKPNAFPRLVDAPGPAVPEPPDKGRLVYDFQIPDRYLGGLPKITNKVRWVREHFPRETRVKIGHDSAWYERDIEAHLATLQRERAS